MWILESNGDFLQGKRMWLKPGQKYLFGRVKRDGVQFAIDHKTVSRKHFIIEVDEVKDGDVTRIHERTKVCIIDQNSKSGTSVNGEAIKGSSRELKSTENSVRPGSCPHELVIKWEPCILTFNLLKKEIKNGVLKTKQDRVKNLDIKAIGEFSSEHTTHVVVNKRNTPKGLQGLITGKYLVSESFIDALEYASNPVDLEDDENLSPLEIDFDNAWPKPQDHLPAPGREPMSRPAELYEPNKGRNTVFEGYTFVFCDESQYDNLLPVVTTGHGKGLLYPVLNGETTENDVVEFMHNAAGRKGFEVSEDFGGRGGTILVRWNSKADFEIWATELIDKISSKTHQAAIDQADFLDAILVNDALQLKRPTTGKAPNGSNSTFTSSNNQGESGREDSVTVNGRFQPRVNGNHRSREQSQPTSATAPITKRVDFSQVKQTSGSDTQTEKTNSNGILKRPRFELSQVSRFKAFDDEFDPDAVVPYDEDEQVQNFPSSPGSDHENVKVEYKDPGSTKKRPRSPHNEQINTSFDDQLDDLAPTAAAIKRRRLEMEADARNQGLEIEPVRTDPTSASIRPRKKKEKEFNILEAAKAQREAEEAARRADDDLNDQLPLDSQDGDFASPAVVEIMNIAIRQRAPATKNPEDDPRWDPRWNGRKNFKGFRAQGDNTRRPSHFSKVIVPLVAIKKQSDGLGDSYWGQTPEEKQREKERKKRSEIRSHRTRLSASHVESPSPETSQTIEASSEQHGNGEDDDLPDHSESSRLQREAAAIVDHEIDLTSPRKTRAADKEDGRSQNSNRSQQQTVGTNRSKASKRPASSAAGSMTKKKQKTLTITSKSQNVSDDDDSDDLKFKFGTRSRRAKGKA